MMSKSSFATVTNAISQMDRQLRIAQPLSDLINVQQRHEKLLAGFAKSPTLDLLTGHEKARQQILEGFGKSPTVDLLMGQRQTMVDQILKSTGSSPILEIATGQSRQWRDQILKSLNASSALNLFGGRDRQLQQIVATMGQSSAMELAYRSWKVSLPIGIANQMAAFQADLLVDLASGTQGDGAADDEGEVWFGAESWSRLLFEMVAILRCAELMTTGLVTAKEGLGAPVPAAVLYLLYMFIAAGELAAHFAKDALAGIDD
jgi:hypothetical protein